jgi:PST family polysaccharide transporter
MARGVTQAGVFVSAVAVARVLGPGPLGRYSLAVSLAGILVGGVGAGIPILALRETAAGRTGAPLNGRLLLSQLTATTIATALLSAAGYFLLGGLDGMVLTMLAGLSFVAMSLVTLGSSLQAGRGRYLAAASGESVTGVAIAGLTLLALSVGWGLRGAVAALLLGALAGALVLWAGVPRSWPGRDGSIGGALRQSAPFLALGLLNAGYLRIDIVILSLVAGANTVGIYSAAYRVLGPFGLLMSGFGTVLLARLSTPGRSQDRWHAVRRHGRLLLVAVTLPFVAAGLLATPWLVEVVYGPGYSASVLPAQILLLSVLPLAWYWPSAHALNAAGRERTWTLLLGIMIVTDAALVAALGHTLGAVGAATAWLLAESLLLIPVSRSAARLRAPGT